jgi:DNA-binding NarL/FixJ family response regulator
MGRSLHVAHRQGLNGDVRDPRSDAGAESSRTVVACVNVSTSRASANSAISTTLLQVLSKLVRSEDRICTLGAGRVVVAFDGVRHSLSAGVLGARLASSAVTGLAATPGIEADVVVGIAEGDPESDTVGLTCAAIDAAGPAEFPGGDRTGSTSFVVATANLRPGLPTIAHKMVGRVAARNDGGAAKTASSRNAESPAVFVIDAAPLSAGTPGPVSRAVTSIIETSGMAVADTVALASHFDAAACIPGWPNNRGALAVLVVHADSGTAGVGADPSATLEKPALLTHALRQSGMRVVVVSVGASNIALAECVVNGAEDAFGIADLSEELANALASTNGRTEHTEMEGALVEPPAQRADRIARLLLLTRGERRVLHHLSTGSTATEIADNLVLSIATVRSHIRSILRKLGVSSQLAAVAIARDQPQRSSEPEHTARVTQPAGVAAPGR